MTKNDPIHKGSKHKGSNEPFSVLLTPNRSLSPRGFIILMSIVTLVAFVSGMVFLIHGAWPVFGFFGIDVALLYWAFKKNYRDGMVYEQIIFSGDEVVVEREKFGRGKKEWRFQPFWLRVECEKLELGAGPLHLSSHGKKLEIAAFLGSEERLALAERLRAELQHFKTVAHGS